jgi:hypothetical protein
VSLAQETDNVVLLDFADEGAVVSSRFISPAMVTVRAHQEEDLSTLPLAVAVELARTVTTRDPCPAR